MTPLRLSVFSLVLLLAPGLAMARLGPSSPVEETALSGAQLFAKTTDTPFIKPVPDMRFGKPGGITTPYANPKKVIPALNEGIVAVRRGQYARALLLLAPLAENGVTRAQSIVGLIYYTGGPGVTKDYFEAARWLEPAAEKGQPEALHNLGILYKRGQGVKQDRAKALVLFQRAAELGHGPSQFKLALIRFTEGDTKLDAAAAAQWMTKAAHNGQVEALSFLGLFYGTGTGVEKDIVEAYKWLSIAADLGDSSALDPLALLDKKLSATDREEAVERAGRWLASQRLTH